MKPRKVERVRAFLGAQILFNNRNSTLDCQIRNISGSGAKLIVSPTVSLPEEFDLAVPQRGRTYKCRLRWRVDEGAGIEFIDPDEPAASRDDNLRAKIRTLESENRRLKKALAELQENA